jgi:hypothetical protein
MTMTYLHPMGPWKPERGPIIADCALPNIVPTSIDNKIDFDLIGCNPSIKPIEPIGVTREPKEGKDFQIPPWLVRVSAIVLPLVLFLAQDEIVGQANVDANASMVQQLSPEELKVMSMPLRNSSSANGDGDGSCVWGILTVEDGQKVPGVAGARCVNGDIVKEAPNSTDPVQSRMDAVNPTPVNSEVQHELKGPVGWLPPAVDVRPNGYDQDRYCNDILDHAANHGHIRSLDPYGTNSAFANWSELAYYFDQVAKGAAAITISGSASETIVSFAIKKVAATSYEAVLWIMTQGNTTSIYPTSRVGAEARHSQGKFTANPYAKTQSDSFKASTRKDYKQIQAIAAKCRDQAQTRAIVAGEVIEAIPAEEAVIQQQHVAIDMRGAYPLLNPDGSYTGKTVTGETASTHRLRPVFNDSGLLTGFTSETDYSQAYSQPGVVLVPLLPTPSQVPAVGFFGKIFEWLGQVMQASPSH